MYVLAMCSYCYFLNEFMGDASPWTSPPSSTGATSRRGAWRESMAGAQRGLIVVRGG